VPIRTIGARTKAFVDRLVNAVPEAAELTAKRVDFLGRAHTNLEEKWSPMYTRYTTIHGLVHAGAKLRNRCSTPYSLSAR
jgi:hypothetical protein